jgi:hypothetical protein
MQRRVQAFLVIHLIEEVTKAGLGLGKVSVLSEVDFLILERFDEALGLGVIIEISGPTHTDPYLMGFEHAGVSLGRILHATIRMMDQGRRHLAWGQGHAEGRTASKRRSSAQPGHRRLQASRSTAR